MARGGRLTVRGAARSPSRAAAASARRSAAAALAATLLAGCAAAPRFDASAVPAVELTDVPFFPQTDYQCGPAALATILADQGLAVDAEDLVPAVYVEGLRGSLQPELLAATRRYGLVPYAIEPDPTALFAELESGRPVLVLQNLGFDRFPVWHYAVVIGYDAERERVLLRSGTERRRGEPLRRFLRSWMKADRWGFVAADPREPPSTAEPVSWIRALSGAAPLLEPAAVDAAFEAAVDRWPGNEVVLFAAAERDAAAGRLDEAASGYEALIALAPDHVAARNNLANVLAERGCRAAALREARAALALTKPDGPLRAAVEDTVNTLTAAAASGAGEAPGACVH
ncbi:MAG TPA: PA2778 family cysteine peptidase [Gammaproteobacteria bacterium]